MAVEPSPDPSAEPRTDRSGAAARPARLRVSRRTFLSGVGAAIALNACSDGNSDPDTAAPTTAPTVPSTSTTVDESTENPTPGESAPSSIVESERSQLSVPLDQRTLVVVELGGGNDILNTVVPHSDGRYFDLRPDLAIADSIDLDGEIGLHPELPILAEEWAAGNVALVEGVGVEKPSLSHFDSMRRWHLGTESPDNTGWVGRYLDATTGFDDLLAGITVGAKPTPAMSGKGSYVVNVATARGLATEFPDWIGDRSGLIDSWSKFAPAQMRAADMTLVERAIAKTAAADKVLTKGLAPLLTSMEGDGSLDRDAKTLTGQLRLAAEMIVAGFAPRVIYVHGFNDFDTHSNQRGTHGELMYELNAGLRYFREALAAADMADRAVIMTTSEFGRRPVEAGNGTDHGTASSQLLIGGLIEGGRYGETHNLNKLDADGNLSHSVDFRSVYATMLDRWLEVDAAEILGKNYETLPVFT